MSELRKEKDRLARQQQICEYLSWKYYDRWRSLLSREEAILESWYVTLKIFGVEPAMYTSFWHISKGFCLTGVGWRGVNLQHYKII